MFFLADVINLRFFIRSSGSFPHFHRLVNSNPAQHIFSPTTLRLGGRDSWIDYIYSLSMRYGEPQPFVICALPRYWHIYSTQRLPIFPSYCLHISMQRSLINVLFFHIFFANKINHLHNKDGLIIYSFRLCLYTLICVFFHSHYKCEFLCHILLILIVYI